MAQTIKIKRSTGSAAPSTLAQGELAYSKGSDTLYVGDPATANTPIAVGGAIKNNAGSPELATGVTAAEIRSLVGVDAAGTDNSTDVTLAGTPDYITISGQTITRNAINLTTDVTGDLPVADGGTGASTAAGARTNLGLGSLATLSAVGAAQITDNTVGAAELNVSGNGTSGQALLSDGDGTFSWGNAGFDADVDNPAIGNGASAGTNSVSIGHDAIGSGSSTVLIGQNADGGTNSRATGIGSDVTVSGADATAYGHDASAAASCTAVGAEAQAISSLSCSFGYGADALASSSVAIGYNSSVATIAEFGVAIGRQATVGNDDGIAIGYLANAGAANTLHINAAGVGTNAPATAGHMVIETDDAKIEYDGDWDISGGTVTVEAMTVTGDLTVSGTTTTVNSTTVTVDDPIFTIGGDTAPASDDNKDRGIEFNWHNGTDAKVGFFGFDDSAGKFTFIPDATNTSEVFSGSAGTIVADLEGNADTATTLETSRNFSLTGDVTASAIGFDGSGNVALSTSIAAGVVRATELASNAVTSVKLASNAVTEGKINDGAVSFDKIAAGAVLTSSETFSDTDGQLMTAAAIDDLIISKGYGSGSGDITGVDITAGNGLTGSVNTTSGDHTQTLNVGAGALIDVSADAVSVDLSELTDMTAAVNGSEDELVLLDNGSQRRKLISEIALSAFNNDTLIDSVQVNSTDGSISGTGTGTAGDISFDLEVATIDGGTY